MHPSQGLECFDPALFKVYQTLVQALANVNDPEIRPFFDLDFAKRPPEELFHLPSDPDQIRNVASDPKFSQNPSKLETRVRNWMSKTNDPHAQNPLENSFDLHRSHGTPPKNSK